MKAPLRLEVKSSWQPYGCGKWVKSIWRAVKRFHRQRCQLWRSRSERSHWFWEDNTQDFEGKVLEKTEFCALIPKSTKTQSISFKKCLFTAIKNIWVKLWLCKQLPWLTPLVCGEMELACPLPAKLARNRYYQNTAEKGNCSWADWSTSAGNRCALETRSLLRKLWVLKYILSFTC